jgi:hypothetical protein
MAYTPAERRAINRAWLWIDAAMSSRMDWSAPPRLRAALLYERRERSSIEAARALLIASFAEGVWAIASPTADPAGVATILGAKMAWRAQVNPDRFEQAKAEFFPLAAMAAQAHEAARARRFAGDQGAAS